MKLIAQIASFFKSIAEDIKNPDDYMISNGEQIPMKHLWDERGLN